MLEKGYLESRFFKPFYKKNVNQEPISRNSFIYFVSLCFMHISQDILSMN